MCQDLSLGKQEAISPELYKIALFSWEADPGKSNYVAIFLFRTKWSLAIFVTIFWVLSFQFKILLSNNMRFSRNMWSENENNLVAERSERPEILPRNLTEITFHFTVFLRIWDRKYCARFIWHWSFLHQLTALQ